MKSFARRALRFVRSEDGPTAVECAVMLALIVVVCLVAITALGTTTNATFTTVDNAIAGS
jgi:pilus assembly protein Flp/PilA